LGRNRTSWRPIFARPPTRSLRATQLADLLKQQSGSFFELAVRLIYRCLPARDDEGRRPPPYGSAIPRLPCKRDYLLRDTQNMLAYPEIPTRGTAEPATFSCSTSCRNRCSTGPSVPAFVCLDDPLQDVPVSKIGASRLLVIPIEVPHDLLGRHGQIEGSPVERQVIVASHRNSHAGIGPGGSPRHPHKGPKRPSV
jgi:hypothetical protein